MRKILLRGCNGRMGQAVSRLCAERDDITVAAGLDIVTDRLFGYPVFTDLTEFDGSADVLVDFSSPNGFDEVLAFCLRKKMPMVVCTTGHSAEQAAAIDKAADEIPILRSGNMSLGIHLLVDLVKRAAAVLGGDFDVEIIEKHHNQKLDAPSGTALMLYGAAADGLPYQPDAVYDRHSVRQKRGKSEIGMHTVRGGTIVGEHEVIFAGQNETVTLSHSAGSREAFATGAVRAALFLASAVKPGLYGMADVL